MKQGKGNTVKQFFFKRNKITEKEETKQRTKKNEVCLLSLNFKLASKQTKIKKTYKNHFIFILLNF